MLFVYESNDHPSRPVLFWHHKAFARLHFSALEPAFHITDFVQNVIINTENMLPSIWNVREYCILAHIRTECFQPDQDE